MSVLENEKYEVENIIILYQKLMLKIKKILRISPVDSIMRRNRKTKTGLVLNVSNIFVLQQEITNRD